MIQSLHFCNLCKQNERWPYLEEKAKISDGKVLVHIFTRNSFEWGLIIVTTQDSIPWLWITAPALRISYAWKWVWYFYTSKKCCKVESTTHLRKMPWIEENKMQPFKQRACYQIWPWLLFSYTWKKPSSIVKYTSYHNEKEVKDLRK